MIRIQWFCLLSAVLITTACAAQRPLPAPEASYRKNAIHLTLRSDPKLNFHEGMPHTLLVCVYQLKDPNAFNQLSGDEDGLYQLLECSLFDPGVLSSKRLTVHPGQDQVVSIDRAEDARFVAVVAGYYLIEKERITRLFEIPVLEKTKGLLIRDKYSELADLNIEVMLGPQQIHSSHSDAGEPEEGN